jgi:hypothetical protein
MTERGEPHSIPGMDVAPELFAGRDEDRSEADERAEGSP